MKMAKASEHDIDAAGQLLRVLNAISEGHYPALGPDDEPNERQDYFDPDDRKHLRHLYDVLDGILNRAPGMPVRVIAGMCYVILYDANEIVDPDADVLELHPKIKKALADSQRLEAAIVALTQARAFIAAERQSFVECSTNPTTHQLDPDDYHHADQMTALLARIDAALGEAPTQENNA